MFLPNDLQSRLKGLRHSRVGGEERPSNPALITWTVFLMLGVIAIIIVGVLSYYRFSYWKDIDARLMEQSGGVTYDEGELRTILEEFEAKSKRTLEILAMVPVVEEEIATTTATSSEVVEE